MNTTKQHYPTSLFEIMFGKSRSEFATTLTEPIDIRKAEAMARAWWMYGLPAYRNSGEHQQYLENINWYYYSESIGDLSFLIHDMSLDVIENGA